MWWLSWWWGMYSHICEICMCLNFSHTYIHTYVCLTLHNVHSIKGWVAKKFHLQHFMRTQANSLSIFVDCQLMFLLVFACSTICMYVHTYVRTYVCNSILLLSRWETESWLEDKKLELCTSLDQPSLPQGACVCMSVCLCVCLRICRCVCTYVERTCDIVEAHCYVVKTCKYFLMSIYKIVRSWQRPKHSAISCYWVFDSAA